MIRSLLYGIAALLFLVAFDQSLNLIAARFTNVERILRLEHDRTNLLEDEIATLQGQVLELEAGE